MFNKTITSMAVMAILSVSSAHAGEAEGRMTLQESLAIESQIARAELLKKLDEASGRGKPGEAKAPAQGVADRKSVV